MIAALSGKNITLIGSFERLNLTTLAPALTACGANWTDSRHASFEDHMEGLLNQHFTLAAREALICAASRTAPRTFTRPAPVLLSSLL